jgi:hypothetical protein
LDHNASGRDSTHPPRDFSHLYLCSTAEFYSVSALGFEEFSPKREWKFS